MAFIRWNELTHIWEIATSPLSKTTPFNHLPIANPTSPLDTANKAYVDSVAGGVAGPAVAIDNAVALFNGTTGKIIKDQTMATIVGRLMKLQTGYPSLSFFDNNGVVDQRYWKFETAFGTFYLMGLNDADTVNSGGRWEFSRDGKLAVSGVITERNRSIPIGEWITFTPAITTPLGGTATGGTAECQYTLIGRTMLFKFILSSYTLTGVSEVRISIPFPVLTNNRIANSCNYHNGINWILAIAYGVSGESDIRIGGTVFVNGVSQIWGTAIISI